jgi:hypothetical protein
MLSQDERADIICSICGQKYAVYYSRRSETECQAALEAVGAALLRHHTVNPADSAHPRDCFNVPEWHGPAHMSGAALLSGAPIPRTYLRAVEPSAISAGPQLLAS